MGALHPANRFAAFLTGRLQPRPQHQPKVLADVPKHCPAQASVQPARVPEPNTVPERTKTSKLTSLCALSTPSGKFHVQC